MNVEELLQDKGIAYIPKGADCVIRCLSPDHEDKNPSLRVDRVTGIFNCLSCGFKGNLFTFFGEEGDIVNMKRELLKKKIYDKLVESVGLSLPPDAIPYHGDWRNIKPETYRKFEAFECHTGDFQGRIVFPIKNIAGSIVVFQGRHTSGGTPKYLFTPRHVKVPLFPIVKPIKGSVLLVEGIYDMINLHDKGLPNAICCFGTMQVNREKLINLKMQGVQSIDVFFDGDDAGQKAAVKVAELCEEIGLKHRNVFKQGVDPGELPEEVVQKLRSTLYK